MRSPQISRQNLIVLLLVLGLIAFAAYFYFFIDPNQVLSILSQTNLIYFTGAFVAYSLFVVFSSLVWQRLLNVLCVRITARKALLYTWVGLFFEATVPQLGWSAEISKTYLFAKDSKIDAGIIGASAVGQKIFSMTIAVAALSFGLASVLINNPLPFMVTSLIALVLALTTLTLMLVFYVSLKPAATGTLLNWLVRLTLFFRKQWDPLGFKNKAEALLSEFHQNIRQLKTNPKGLALPIVYALIGFFFEVGVVFLVFLALGYEVPVDKVLIVFTLTGTLQTVGVTFFGLPEVIMTASFTALGIPAELSFSVALLTRVVNMWFRLIVSFAALQFAGIGFMRGIRRS